MEAEAEVGLQDAVPGTTAEARAAAGESPSTASLDGRPLTTPLFAGGRSLPLEAIVRGAAEHGAAFLGAGVLHLEPGVREHFDGFLSAEAPILLSLYRRLSQAQPAGATDQTPRTRWCSDKGTAPMTRRPSGATTVGIARMPCCDTAVS